MLVATGADAGVGGLRVGPAGVRRPAEKHQRGSPSLDASDGRVVGASRRHDGEALLACWVEFSARYVGDCVGALTLFENPSGRDSSGKVPWAGLARAVVSKCGRSKESSRVAWTLAHRNIALIDNPVAKEKAELNAEVVVAADFAPPPFAVQA